MESVFSSNQFPILCLFVCSSLWLSRWLWCWGGLVEGASRGVARKLFLFSWIEWPPPPPGVREWDQLSDVLEAWPRQTSLPLIINPLFTALRVSHFLLGARSSFYQLLAFNCLLFEVYLNYSKFCDLSHMCERRNASYVNWFLQFLHRKTFCILKWEGCPVPDTRFCTWYTICRDPFKTFFFLLKPQVRSSSERGVVQELYGWAGISSFRWPFKHPPLGWST